MASSPGRYRENVNPPVALVVPKRTQIAGTELALVPLCVRERVENRGIHLASLRKKLKGVHVKKVVLFLAAQCLASIGLAEVCTTQSRGLNFSAGSREQVIAECHANAATINAECDAYVTCDDQFRSGRSCTTQSRGLNFTAPSLEQVKNECHINAITINAECDAYATCSRTNGGDQGGQRGDQGGYGRGDQGGQQGRPQPTQPSRPTQPTQPQRPTQPVPQPARDPGQCYLQRYPDICQNSPKNYCRNPAKHFQDYGSHEGRIWGCQ